MKGLSRPCACACEAKTSTPTARACSANSRQRRLLAIPGSAAIRIAAPYPPAAPDEGGEAAPAGGGEPRAGGADPRQLEDPHRPAGPLDLELAQVLQGAEAADQLRGGPGQVGLGRLGA